MPRLVAGTRQFDIHGIVLDKDGTLIDLEQAWGPRTINWVENLVQQVGGTPNMEATLFDLLGYDRQRRQAIPDGPFISASEATIAVLAAGSLYQHGLPWQQAEKIAKDTSDAAYREPLTAAEVQPIGDVAGAVRRWREAGLAVGVATADSRETTEQSLAYLGITDLVDPVMCSDDDLPQKPDAAVMNWISERWGCRPDQILMVGDTMTDMLTGRNGGAAGTVAIVSNGLVTSAALQQHADAVLGSIDELRLLP